MTIKHTYINAETHGHASVQNNDLKLLYSGEGIIRTFSGIMFNVFEPSPENMCIEDIAHALSHQCRFGGHTARFYSVAEHCIKCSELVLKKHMLAALMHDAAEAYLIDIPTPLKAKMPEYIETESKLMKAIAEKFGFEYPFHEAIYLADRAMLELEWQNLMIRNTWIPMPSDYAMYKFLELYNTLK